MPSLVEIGINVVLHEKIDENVKVYTFNDIGSDGSLEDLIKGGIWAVQPSLKFQRGCYKLKRF